MNSQRQSPIYKSRLLQQAAERSPETHPLTWRLRDDGEVVNLREYESKEGYRAVSEVLNGHDPGAVIAAMKEARAGNLARFDDVESLLDDLHEGD